MMAVKRLTQIGKGKSIFIDFKTGICFYRIESDEFDAPSCYEGRTDRDGPFTRIILPGGGIYDVVESPEEITKAINGKVHTPD
jgi:hypothetical protein